MQLRNCILIALAFDATPEEVDAAHDAIDRQFSGANPADYLVTATVPGQAQQPAASNTPAPAANTSGAQLDKDGLPWDERIHSSNKALTATGVWRARRNVAPALKTQVEAELRATLGAAPAPAAASTPPTPAPAAGAAAGGPPMPGANQPPMPGANQPDPAYTNLVQFIAQNTKSAANPAGKFDDEYIKQVLTHYGVAEGSLQNLAHRLDLVPQVDGWLRSVLAQ